MSDEIKYSCNACGRYITAGSGHDCYQPLRTSEDVLRERTKQLEAENAELKQQRDALDRWKAQAVMMIIHCRGSCALPDERPPTTQESERGAMDNE